VLDREIGFDFASDFGSPGHPPSFKGGRSAFFGQEIARIGGDLSRRKPNFRGDVSMWKQRAVTLCGCLAALPLLIGCANGVAAPPQAYIPPAPTVAAAPDAGARVYAVAPGQPAAILVMLPDPRYAMSTDARLWAAQGFDVVAPSPPEIYQIAADQQAAVVRLIAQAQAIANAPVWLMGPNLVVEEAMAAMPPSGPDGVSGVVVTSTTSGVEACSERMTYSYSGNGAPPKVSVTTSGNACPSGSPFGAGTNSTLAPPAPAVRQSAPRLIETSLPARSLAARRAAVREVADLIKSAPPG
jgi:hypothetical protein